MKKIALKSIKKENYLLSGAVESAVIFFDMPTIGASLSVKEDAVIVCERSACRFHIGKKGITSVKNDLLSTSNEVIEREFKTWQKKWHKKDALLYLFSTESSNWLLTWKKLNSLAEQFWSDSYQVETLDSFADELEAKLSKDFEKKGISKYLSQMISPSSPTIIQQMDLDRGKISEKKYVRKYWYFLGNWNGGDILAQGHLSNIHFTVLPDFRKLEKLHLKYDEKVTKETLRLLKLLRVFTLWREERKAILQKMCLGYKNIIMEGSRTYKIDPKLFAWVRFSELSKIQESTTFLEDRKKSCVYYLPKGKKEADIITGKEAEFLTYEFTKTEKVKEIKGTIASRGQVSGVVRRILKEHQFSRFQDGEILVTTMTRPEYLPLMKKAAAIVTDEGGLTSHAAIVARELGKPCIIGTKMATQVLQDGQMVNVDANNGIVTLLR